MPKRPVRVSRCRGIAMLLVVIAVAVATILSLGLAASLSTSVRLSRNIAARLQARSVAESGLVMAIAYIRGNSNWRNEKTNGLWVQDHPFADGTFTIYGEDGEDTDGDGAVEGDGDLADNRWDMLTLTAVGRRGGTSHTVRALVLPPKTALMIVPDPNALGPEEIARRELLVGWGWGVKLLDDNATSGEFDAAVADNVDVIYFPAHVQLETDVKDKLKITSVPIVLEHWKLPRELKMTKSDGANFTSSYVYIPELTVTYIDDLDFEVTETYTHYITEPFPVGDCTIYNIADTMHRLNPGKGTGMDALAHKPGGGPMAVALSAMVCGALNSGKKPARSQRVVLPWGQQTFSIQLLNANGRRLLKRSLDWAGSAWTGLLPGVATWDRVEIRDAAYIDGYDPELGPYGGANVNADATVSTNSGRTAKFKVDGGQLRGTAYLPLQADASKVIQLQNGGTITGGVKRMRTCVPMPATNEPDIMPPDVGDVTYSTGTTDLISDLHVQHLTITGDAIVTISVDVAILCQDEMRVEQNGQLIVNDGATLTMYTKKRVRLTDNARVNIDTTDPSRLSWIILKDRIEVGGNAQLCAAVQGFGGEVKVKETGHFYGTFIGKKFKVEHNGAAHIDTAHSGTIVTMGGAVDLGRTTAKGFCWIEQR